MISAVLAVLLLTAGATALYLAAPHQSLRASKAGPPVAIGGVLALSAALGLLLTVMGPATAVFTWLTALMVLWSLPPVVIGWQRWRKKENAQ